jgi:hypothetical protein
LISAISNPAIFDYFDHALDSNLYSYYVVALFDSLDSVSRDLNYYNIYRDDEVIGQAASTFYLDEYVPPDWLQYYVTAIYDGGYESGPSNAFYIVVSVDENYLNCRTELIGNYPNPFNPETTISFDIAQTFSFVTLVIYNIKGQKVKTLISDSASQLSAGQHSVTWNGTDDNNKPVSSGIYFCKLKAGDFQKVKKMVLIK